MDQQQGGWVYPTNAKSAFLLVSRVHSESNISLIVPTVALAVGGKQYTVNPSDFGFGDAGNGMTFGGIQSRGNNPFDILGDVFLKVRFILFSSS